MVNFLFRVYASEEIISQAYAEVQNTSPSTAVGETDYGDQLRRRAKRCANVFTDNGMKSLFAEVLLTAIRQQVRHILSSNPKLEYMELVHFSKRCGDYQRGGARRRTGRTPASPFRIPTRLSQKRQVMTLDTKTEKESFYAANPGERLN